MGGARVGRRGRALTWGGAPQDGWTPLFVAANNSHFAVVELLAAKGADTNVVLNVSGGRVGGEGQRI